MVSTRDVPGPFDGFSTAAPGEPIFTLQAGDPLAWRLVRLWVWRTRREAMRSDDTALLVKVAEAEEIQWAMQEWLAGKPEPVEPAPGNHYSGYVESEEMLAAKDIHDRRIAAARRLDNAVYELNEVADGVAGIDLPMNVGNALRALSCNVKDVSAVVRPHREDAR